MALSFGKTDARKMAAVLEPEYEDWAGKVKELKKQAKTDESVLPEKERLEELCAEVEEFGLAALEAAQEIIAAKAKFTVVAQVKEKDNKGDKIALGWYATEKQAMDDALKMTYSTVTHEEALAWIIKIHHGTPHDWYKARKVERNEREMGNTHWRVRELHRREKWFAEHPGEKPPADWGVIPFDNQTVKCEVCFGTGRIPETGPYSA